MSKLDRCLHSGLVILEASRSPCCEEAQFELVTEWRDLCDVPAGQSSMQGRVISDTPHGAEHQPTHRTLRNNKPLLLEAITEFWGGLDTVIQLARHSTYLPALHFDYSQAMLHLILRTL